ncbi:MAG: hypothetical protein QM764_12480 [Chitinophagaceae bacterium]
MKKFVILALLILSLQVSAQVRGIDKILQSPETKVDFYTVAEAGCRVMYLPMEFGKSDFTFLQKEFLEKLDSSIVIGVDLVYTDFPKKTDFFPLNKKRLEHLQRIFPALFDNDKIAFRKFRQNAETKEIAIGLTHGFYIYYRPIPSKRLTEVEIKKLKDMLRSGEIHDRVVSSDTSAVDYPCFLETAVTDTGLIPDPISGYTQKVRSVSIKDAIKEKLIDTFEYPGKDSIYFVYYYRDEGCDSYGESVISFDSIDSTVSSVFRRNKWKSSVIIADVTGSMYPYTGQFLQWLKLNMVNRDEKEFIFFNDGDDKRDAEKIIGKTGGIYSVHANSYDEVESVVMNAMNNGSGGDAPENNIEALIHSQEFCAKCDSVIMVVDNWAPVKDMILLGQIHRPVKIVVCGVFDRINTDYLKIARETKGSIHLIEEDIYNLSDIKEGGSIRIHGKNYKLIKGEFVSIASMAL